MMMLRQLLMRSSVGKALEHRSALTPTTAKILIDAGYTVRVERSPERIFEDSEFEAVGATLVPEDTWREAPTDHIIIGLKELPVEECKPIAPSHQLEHFLTAMQFPSSTSTSSSHIAISNKAAGKRSSPASPAAVVPSLISNSSSTTEVDVLLLSDTTQALQVQPSLLRHGHGNSHTPPLNPSPVSPPTPTKMPSS
jgi:hypothetical protein